MLIEKPKTNIDEIDAMMSLHVQHKPAQASTRQHPPAPASTNTSNRHHPPAKTPILAPMEPHLILLAAICFLAIAFLYSSVGHAGASGYLAVMALLSFPAASIKPMSLIMNIFVAGIASYKFIQAGRFDRRVFITVAAASIPMAFLGGYLELDTTWFRLLAGIFLISSALLMLAKHFIRPVEEIQKIHLAGGLSLGAVIGFFSGLLGVGGGIFLSPAIIMMGWTTVKHASGVAALFILFNSAMGLAGHITALRAVPFEILWFILAVVAGGYAGAHFGSSRFDNRIILVLLFIVLVTAGVKFLLVG